MPADGRRVDAAVGLHIHQVDRVAVQRRVLDAVADQGPVDQVLAVVDGQAREVLESGIDDVEILADADDGRVGIAAAQDRVAEAVGLGERAERDNREQAAADKTQCSGLTFNAS